MNKKKVNERFQYFSIVINVREDKKINWSSLEKDELVYNMKELKFLTPMDLAIFLKNFKGIAQKQILSRILQSKISNKKVSKEFTD